MRNRVVNKIIHKRSRDFGCIKQKALALPVALTLKQFKLSHQYQTSNEFTNRYILLVIFVSIFHVWKEYCLLRFKLECWPYNPYIIVLQYHVADIQFVRHVLAHRFTLRVSTLTSAYTQIRPKVYLNKNLAHYGGKHLKKPNVLLNFANVRRNIAIGFTVWVEQVAIRALSCYRFRPVFK